MFVGINSHVGTAERRHLSHVDHLRHSCGRPLAPPETPGVRRGHGLRVPVFSEIERQLKMMFYRQ
jgi:hypothetical protein